MLNTILGSKQGMSQVFLSGRRIPVTKISTNPCVVTHIKNEGKDGYWAIQLGYGTKKDKNTPKSLKGHLKNSYKNQSPIFIRETKTKNEPNVKVGETVKASDIFNVGDTVSVTGVSKGKGFAGGVKRWGFGGGPKTHGQSDRHRAPGSIGQGTTPGRVRKGKKMAGRMGTQTVTIKNLKIVNINLETGELLVSGPVAGHLNTPLIVTLIKKTDNKTEKLKNEETEEQKDEGTNKQKDKKTDEPGEVKKDNDGEDKSNS